MSCTLLMVSSRFFVLPGPGAFSRSQRIHNILWEECQKIIQRVSLGRETLSTTTPQVLGILESLVLMSDWHPQLIQLPSDDSAWDSELTSQCDRRNIRQRNRNTSTIRWEGDVFDSVNQSNELSCGLLSTAVTLAFRAAIFTDESIVAFPILETRHTGRFNRIRNLLYVYANEIAGRLNCSSLLSEDVSVRSMSVQGENEINLWVDLRKLTHLTSVTFASSRSAMKEVLSGNYSVIGNQWVPSLKHWYDRFKSQISGKNASHTTFPMQMHITD